MGPDGNPFFGGCSGGHAAPSPPSPPPDRPLAPAARLALPGTSPAPLPCGAAIDSTRLPLPFSTAPETLGVRLAGKVVRSGLALVDWNGPVDVGLYCTCSYGACRTAGVKALFSQTINAWPGTNVAKIKSIGAPNLYNFRCECLSVIKDAINMEWENYLKRYLSRTQRSDYIINSAG